MLWFLPIYVIPSGMITVLSIIEHKAFSPILSVKTFLHIVTGVLII